MAKSEKKEKPQLCAAVLFNMLCQMKRDADDEGIEITDPRVMGGLVYLIKGENPAPTGKENKVQVDTSNFRQCKTNGSPNLPFDKDNKHSGRLVRAFLRSLEKDYEGVYRRACVFCRKYINLENRGMLDMIVSGILDIMVSDFDITDDQLFYILPGNTEAVTQSTLLDRVDNAELELESLIIGTLRWIFENDRKNSIEKGKTENWLQKVGNSGYKMRDDIELGEDLGIEFDILFPNYSDDELVEGSADIDVINENDNTEDPYDNEVENDDDSDEPEDKDEYNTWGDSFADQQAWGRGMPQIVIGVKGDNNNVANKIGTISYIMPGDKHE